MSECKKEVTKVNTFVYIDIILMVILLLAFGLIMIYSASAYMCEVSQEYNYDSMYLLKRQAFFITVGLGLVVIFQCFRVSWIVKKFAIPMYVVGCMTILLLLTPLGVSANGATRWISFVGIRFQVAEIVKFVVIGIDAYLIKRYRRHGRVERDLFSTEFEDKRVIRLTGEVNCLMADQVLAEIAYLDEKGNDDITMYINSPGGSVSDGLAIVDAMQRSKSDIRVIVTGRAASMGAFIATVGGTKGKRCITKNAEMMIHQPLGGIQGQASDVELAATHIVFIKRKLNQMLASATGKAMEDVTRDTDRDYFLDAKAAVQYGLVDYII